MKTYRNALCLTAVLACSVGCTSKIYKCQSGLVLALQPKNATEEAMVESLIRTEDAKVLFKTSSTSLPNRTSSDEDISWIGVTLQTEYKAYDALDFVTYALQDHYHRMHKILLKDGAQIKKIMTVKPLDFEPVWDVVDIEEPSANTEPPEGLPQSSLWPKYNDPTWYQRDEYTQLAKAKREVLGQLAEGISEGKKLKMVTVGHIDTGYTPGHVGTPTNLAKDLCVDFTGDEALFGSPKPDAVDVKVGDNPILNAHGHGTGTLTVLAAANTLEYQDESGVLRKSESLGAVPFAKIACVRARPVFMHFFPVRLARSIMHCVTNDVDVVSISQGGTSSLALTAAVNEAYMRGTLLVAASSDFVDIVGWSVPFKDMAYPARYPRVLAAAGITGRYNSYGDSLGLGGFLRFIFPPWCKGDALAWVMRGSYGPKESMGNAICGFAPNIPFADPNSNIRFDLDGGGTSSTTPQIAGAAALWLLKYQEAVKDYLDKQAVEDRGWKKNELVMKALLKTAATTGISEREPVEKFGAGYLQAHGALQKTPLELSRYITLKEPVSYPQYTNLSKLAGAVYLCSLSEQDFSQLDTVFKTPEDRTVLENVIGGFMRQALVAKEMFVPGFVEEHQQMEQLLQSYMDSGFDPRHRAQVITNGTRILNRALGRISFWKRERRWYDAGLKLLAAKLSEKRVEVALDAWLAGQAAQFKVAAVGGLDNYKHGARRMKALTVTAQVKPPRH